MVINSKNNFSFDNRGQLQCKSSSVDKVRRGILLRGRPQAYGKEIGMQQLLNLNSKQRDPAKVATRN
jgi:hypothetical protein